MTETLAPDYAYGGLGGFFDDIEPDAPASLAAPTLAAEPPAALARPASKRPPAEWLIPEPFNARAARAVARSHGLAHPLVAALLLRRGMVDSELALYLHPDPARLEPPALRNIDGAARVVDEAIRRGRRITIYGDYDVDGTTGASLLQNFLKFRGADVRSFIPFRNEGYGLSKNSIERIKNEQRAELILTVDCGTSSRVEVDFARSLGMEVVVTDHHLPTPGKETSGIVVNPHVGNDPYPNKDLAGVGVAYKLIGSIYGKQPLANLDLVAMGTIADVMRLGGENRTLVRIGLERLGHTRRTGLRSLLGTAIKPITCSHGTDGECFPVTAEQIAFQIGPRINAIGRMGLDPMLVVELLTTDDEERGLEIAKLLDEANKERRVVTGGLVDEAIERVDPVEPVIVLQMDVFKGLAGLVAGRLASEFGRPTIIIDKDGHGSARSVEGVDLRDILIEGYGDLVTAAGHNMAMGISNVRDVDGLRKALLGHPWPAGLGGRTISIDAVCELSDLDRDLIRALRALEPTGAGNPAPLLAVSNVRVAEVSTMSDGKHARLRLTDESGVRRTAVWFNHGGGLPDEGDLVDVAGRPALNVFRGAESVELMVTAVRPSAGPLPVTLA